MERELNIKVNEEGNLTGLRYRGRRYSTRPLPLSMLKEVLETIDKMINLGISVEAEAEKEKQDREEQNWYEIARRKYGPEPWVFQMLIEGEAVNNFGAAETVEELLANAGFPVNEETLRLAEKALENVGALVEKDLTTVPFSSKIIWRKRRARKPRRYTKVDIELMAKVAILKGARSRKEITKLYGLYNSGIALKWYKVFDEMGIPKVKHPGKPLKFICPQVL